MHLYEYFKIKQSFLSLLPTIFHSCTLFSVHLPTIYHHLQSLYVLFPIYDLGL